MAKYISQLRRGVKDDATGRNDWAEYEAQENHIPPLEGELVLEYDNGIPRLKIGNGKDEFSALPYMSVDSFLLPKAASVYLDANAWELMPDDDGDRYCQVVTVQNAVITPNSKVDLTPNSFQLDEFRSLGLVFVAENENGIIRVCCLGSVPTQPYMVGAIVTEVILSGDKIIGNTTAIPRALTEDEIITLVTSSEEVEDLIRGLAAGGDVVQVQANWEQTDSSRPDYIKNKPDLGALSSKDTVEKTDLAEDIQTLPTVTADDDGKVLQVVDGAWTIANIESSGAGTYVAPEWGTW